MQGTTTRSQQDPFRAETCTNCNPEKSNTEPTVYGMMKARFATKCSACGDMIKVGKEISRDSNDRWVHKHCADDTDELP